MILNPPWSNISTARRLIILDICAELFVNPTRGLKDIERTRNTVIQSLTLNYDLDLKPTLVKHTHCTAHRLMMMIQNYIEITLNVYTDVMSYLSDVISPQYNNYALSDGTKDHTKNSSKTQTKPKTSMMK